MKPFSSKRAGWTITETLMAVSVTSVMTAGLVVGAYTIQRSFQASRQHIAAQAQQMRVMDYINLDLRRALSVDAQERRLTLTIPDYYDSSDNPREPQIVDGMARYGSAAKTVQYYQEDAVIYRQEGTTKTALATGVQDFQLTFGGLGESITVGVTFRPTFQLSGDAETARNATATFSTTLLRNKRKN